MQIKKRFALLLLWVAIVFMATRFRVFAADLGDSYFDTNREDFVIENNVLVKYQGSEEAVVVPEGVTEIGYNAFFDQESISSVILPEGVTKINFGAFQECVNLETVRFPSTLKEIQRDSFRYCEKLHEVIIPEGVTKIGIAAFAGCKELKILRLPNTLQEIEAETFSNCEKLEKVVIPKGVTKIGTSAFRNCRSLREIQIPSAVKDPGDRQTYGLTPWLETQVGLLTEKSPFFIVNNVLIAAKDNLETEVTIPDEVEKIANYAFEGTEFENITISGSVTEIGIAAFGDCRNLKTVYMPDSVRALGSDAFRNCYSLKKVRLSDSITFLKAPFANCRQLEELELPKNLENLEGPLIISCKKLKKLIVYDKLKRSRAVCLPNGTDITAKNVHKKIVIYVDKGSPVEKYLRSLKGEEKIAYAYNEKSSKESAKYKTYTVKKGDSLWKIAKNYLGSGSRYPEIVKLNQLGKKGIKPGQKLRLPKK